MRIKRDRQGILKFCRPSLKLTERHYARYEAIDRLLGEAPGILGFVHDDLKKALITENRKRRRRCAFTADNVLRIMICKAIEAETFRGIVVRIDDSSFFRQFVGIHDRPMMDYTTLNKLANCIRPTTWTKVNGALSRHAVEQKRIDGKRLRLDTTAVEVNIHWPSDSGLLWDTYRVLARLVEQARELDPGVAGDRRLQVRRAKRLHVQIQRYAGRKQRKAKSLKGPYRRLLGLVEAILELGDAVGRKLNDRLATYDLECHLQARSLIVAIRDFGSKGSRVVDQARRRVVHEEQVPNDEKIFSIFEPHAELLIRGRPQKPIEFGHMIGLQQVDGRFITHYRVFEKKPNEHQIIAPALQSHIDLFGEPPSVLTADKGYYESMARIGQLEQEVELVAIAKKGNRTEEETKRETDALFRIAQCFRAGIEGSISFLKRCLRLTRCFNKGLVHYKATIGLTIFAHNLIVLAADTS